MTHHHNFVLLHFNKKVDESIGLVGLYEKIERSKNKMK